MYRYSMYGISVWLLMTYCCDVVVCNTYDVCGCCTLDTTGIWLYDLMATTLARSTDCKYEYVMLVDCMCVCMHDVYMGCTNICVNMYVYE